MKGIISGLPILFHWSMFIFTPTSHCLDYSFFVVSCKIRKCESSNFVLFSRLSWLFWVPCNSMWLLGSAHQLLKWPAREQRQHHTGMERGALGARARPPRPPPSAGLPVWGARLVTQSSGHPCPAPSRCHSCRKRRFSSRLGSGAAGQALEHPSPLQESGCRSLTTDRRTPAADDLHLYF